MSISGDFIGERLPTVPRSYDERIFKEEAKPCADGTHHRQWARIGGKTVYRERVIRDDAFVGFGPWREGEVSVREEGS